MIWDDITVMTSFMTSFMQMRRVMLQFPAIWWEQGLVLFGVTKSENGPPLYHLATQACGQPEQYAQAVCPSAQVA